ncbi:N-alpha-acetyltransferase 50 [Actinomortierella ambigua]|uniref:N-alpha-acetyltransferase 50 n=1 Tax=Actinomortierella ambigua TaxID=1343610 RepID=A0A9P6U8L0_9FUNG|nr:N-alpha-acetyltransferase 50 [Actinomortierella ambigua]KAG0263868.1 N-alpha-acetyltransferase 50 [Actinomortierella ambigua]
MSSNGTRASSHRIALGDINPNNLGQLKRINTVIFPINYQPSFYKDVLEVGEFAKIAYFNDVCVAAVCCRKDPTPEATAPHDLYIATLGVLAPYRRLGLGTALLEHILEHAAEDKKIGKVYLHVQTTNEEALAFYKKHGFEQKEKVANYYPNFDDSDAYRLEKVLVQ